MTLTDLKIKIEKEFYQKFPWDEKKQRLLSSRALSYDSNKPQAFPAELMIFIRDVIQEAYWAGEENTKAEMRPKLNNLLQDLKGLYPGSKDILSALQEELKN